MTTGTGNRAARDLEPLAFFIADHGAAESGKLYVNGGFFTSWRLPSYPAIVPPFTVCAAINVPPRAYQQDHTFDIALVDADGAQLFHTDGQFRAVPNLEMRPGDPVVMPLTLVVAGLQIGRAGDYTFVLSIDGTPLDRYQVRAIQVPIPPAPPAFTDPPS